MRQARSNKAVGIALLGLGALILLLGLIGGAPALRTGGPALAFLGIVMLAQAKRRG
jgi:hypothetical protein